MAKRCLEAARRGLRPDAVLGLRLSCDELAPWAGVTPDAAAEIAAALAPLVDHLVVVRGAIFSLAETRPTGHHGTGFNLDLTAAVRNAVGGAVPVFAQGSIVDLADAEAAVGDERCDGVEMTRAQIADPELAAKAAAGTAPRPCVLCNQRCRVRDNRNPIVSCIVEPRAGWETVDPPVTTAANLDGGAVAPVLIVGSGPAGLEAARVAARRGAAVTVIEAADRPGGLLPTIARSPGHERFDRLAEWLVADATDAGVTFRFNTEADAALIDAFDGSVILATGAAPGPAEFEVAAGARVLAPTAVLTATDDAFDELVPASVAVWDPIGNSTGVAVAELLAARGRAVTFVTPDPVAGNLLSLTGDLAGCNVRLQQAGVTLERRQQLLRVDPGSITIEHRFTAVPGAVAVEAVVDCGPRLPAVPAAERVSGAGGATVVGDAVAARTVGEAIREGRAAALAATERAPVGAGATDGAAR